MLKARNFSEKTAKRGKKAKSIKERREGNKLVEIEKELKVIEEFADRLTTKDIMGDPSLENDSNDNIKGSIGNSVNNI